MKRTKIKFGEREVEPEVRKLFDMKQVIYDREWLNQADNRILYLMYRDLYHKKHKETIENNKLRYDITVMPPFTMGNEYVKTKGHYHTKVPGKDLSYPEIYEVMQGEAHFLLQKKNKLNGPVEDIVLYKAESGDKVIIPPNCGHVTINPGSTTLKISNWIYDGCSNTYGEIVDRQGAAYYELKEGFSKNPNYDQVPDLKIKEPFEVDDLKIKGNLPLYYLIRRPENLRFLRHPEKFPWLFEEVMD